VGREPVLHGALEEGLALELEVLLLHLNVEGAKHLGELLLLVIHGRRENLADRVEDEHVEGALVGLAGALPLLLGRDEVVLAPQALSHLRLRDAELLRVHARENREGEGPAMETGRERDGTLLRVNLEITHGLVLVGGDDNVHVLHVLHELSVHGLRIKLELEETTVELVNGENRLDTLSQRLAEHSLGLNRHTVDTVNHHQSSVSDTERSGNLS
jgi:hypothetical protein